MKKVLNIAKRFIINTTLVFVALVLLKYLLIPAILITGIVSFFKRSFGNGVMTFQELNNGVFTRYLDFAVGTQGSTAQVDVSDRFVMPSGSDWEMRILEVANSGGRASFNGILLRVKN